MAMNCPNCLAPMTSMTLGAHLSTPVAIDLCTPCQAFWFDKYESLKLSPGSILQLMKLIGDHTGASPALIEKALPCPRCSASLRVTNDIQRSTRFSYWRCGNEHGKFIRFFDFLKEKNFVAPMPAADIEELKKNVRAVNCSNCGAPIDLALFSACTHCGSAISMLDMKQAQKTLEQLQKAAEPRAVDPALPFELAMAKRDVERTFGPVDSSRNQWGSDTSSALVQEVLHAVSRWLTRI